MITLCVALEQELPDPPKGFNILYTGVGKVQAAVALAKHLTVGYRPMQVWNYGTAGGLNKFVGGLVEVDTFVQRDMIADPLAPRGQIPFTNPQLGDIKTHNKSDYQIICGTGDSFVTEPDIWYVTHDIDIVDMEGWALAYVCQQWRVPFRSFKFVSDSADSNANNDWANNVAKGQELFKQHVKEIK